MATLPKRRLSTRIINVSLPVAATTVLIFGVIVFGIEFQTGIRDAQLRLQSELQALAKLLSRDIKRREGQIRLLTENPKALQAAIQSLKHTRNPAVFFGSGVLRYEIVRQSEETPLARQFAILSQRGLAGGLNVFELPDTANGAGVFAEGQTMVADQMISVRVVWDVGQLISDKDWLRPGLFHGLAVANHQGRRVWKIGTYPDQFTAIQPDGDRVREAEWNDETWIEISVDLEVFPEPVALHAVFPKSVLYDQAWKMSRGILVRTFTILALGVCLIILLAFRIRQAMRPLDQITGGVRRIASGDLETPLESQGDDEIAFLADTLNDLMQRLKVKEQSVQAHIQLLKEKNDELEALSSRLREVDRLKDQFLAILSHELRTPLTAILGYAELSLDGIYGQMNDKQREILSFIQSNGNKLLSLMEDLLDIAKIRAGTIEVNSEEFSMKELLADIEKYGSNAIRIKPEVRYVQEAHPPLPGECVTDRVKLEQILTNLISNAVKFTERGYVKLSVRQIDPEFVEFQVEDTGIGIAQQYMPKVFDAFVQLDSGIRRRYGGTGLGLTISKSLAEKMGGGIRLESEIGKGSRFTLTLPAVYRAPAAVEGAVEGVKPS